MNPAPLLPHQAESEALKLVRPDNPTKLMATALMLVLWLNQFTDTASDQPVNNGDDK